MIDEKIRKHGPSRRDPLCLQTTHAIIIPAGTILRQEHGKAGTFTMPVAGGVFSIEEAKADRSTFKKVVA